MHRPGPKVVNSSWLKAHWDRPEQESLHLVYPGVDLDVFHPGPRLARTVDAALQDRGPWARGRPVEGPRRASPGRGKADHADRAAALRYGVEGHRRQPWGHERHLGGLAPQALASLYRSVDVVVTPSWFESFPLPPLEAMACGTPVITTREGTEDYAEDGHNALVVPGRDVRALAEAITRLARDRDLQLRLRAAGPETARRFTWAAGYSMFEAALEGSG